ncbi:MAG: YitT family protein [Bacteroidales bacterium]|nr:YitT family protein [Bacteroidales bacterium]MCF8336765.1 YitT family protein [Bacteroidales bacterium]
MKDKKQVIFSILSEYSIITVGLFINALGWTAFLIPSNIVGGGITGLSSVVYFATGIPVGPVNLAANAVLILLAFKALGKGFGFKTIYSFTVVSIFLTYLQSVIHEPVVDDRFLSAIVGGMLGGGSIGLIFTQGGSTGGTEIIAMLVNKKRNISPGKIILVLDVVIIASSFLVFGEIEAMVYGYVTMGVVSYVIDLMLTGNQRSVQLFIFSKNAREVADVIGNDLQRGVTLVKGQGWFTQQDFDIVMVIVRKRESTHIFRLVKEIDPEAFISVASVMGVYGKGFDQLKIKPGRKKRKRFVVA